eukprot:jgi/Antlo1/74/1267
MRAATENQRHVAVLAGAWRRCPARALTTLYRESTAGSMDSQESDGQGLKEGP